MSSPITPPILSTTFGEFPLHEYRLRRAGREWTILHATFLLTPMDEAHFLDKETNPLPYGVALWPAAIALAYEVLARGDMFRDKRILELGAGTGLPGIVAASLGGHVVQADSRELVMSVCRDNGQRNDIHNIEYCLVDWCEWEDIRQYDWILGADILYIHMMHASLRHIFESNLAPGGRVLLADPFRGVSLSLLETLAAAGWQSTLTKWIVGEETTPCSIGVYELVPPSSGRR